MDVGGWVGACVRACVRVCVGVRACVLLIWLFHPATRASHTPASGDLTPFLEDGCSYAQSLS